MRKVIKYETLDGKAFSYEKNARVHINKLYGERLTFISLEAIKKMPNVKYQDMMEFIDEYLHHFEKAIEIKKDITLINDSEEI